MRLADRFPTAATVAISPAPMVPVEGLPAAAGLPPTRLHPEISGGPPRRMPNNLLILIGQLDLPFAAPAANKLLAMAGGQRDQEEDFREKRAVRSQVIPMATHTSLLFSRRVADATALWAMQGLQKHAASCKAVPPWKELRLASEAAGLVGLMLVFPFCASLFARVFALPRLGGPARRSPKGVGGKKALLVWLVLGVVVTAALRWAVPLRWVVWMYGGDYLASFLMLVGLIAMLLHNSAAAETASASGARWGRAVAMAATLGLLTILAFGAWLDRELTDAWLNAARWWRFAALLPLLLPYFLAEEANLGPPVPDRLGAQRFALFLGLRLELWLAMLAGLFFLHSQEELVLLLGVYLGVFSVLQRLGMDAVRRRTGSPMAAAVFGAILGAWFIAAVFPIV